MTTKQWAVLRLLEANPGGLYGSQFVQMAGIGRGTIYVLLERLVDRGLVREVDEPATSELRLPRTRHFITDAGLQQLSALRQPPGA